MDIMNGLDAYNITKEYRFEMQYQTLKDFTEVFNREVKKCASNGGDVCVLPWVMFGVQGNPTEEDFANFATFVEYLIDSNYEVEYYYHNPRHHDASGLIVAWGPDAAAHIQKFFETTHTDVYKGEEIGVRES